MDGSKEGEWVLKKLWDRTLSNWSYVPFNVESVGTSYKIFCSIRIPRSAQSLSAGSHPAGLFPSVLTVIIFLTFGSPCERRPLFKAAIKFHGEGEVISFPAMNIGGTSIVKDSSF